MIDVTKRIRLSCLLAEAAELEHLLVCQYLYMGFSMKRRAEEGVTLAQLEQMRRWGASLFLIARQEMEHLGLVANLSTAIGQAPELLRPTMPTAQRAYPIEEPSRLQRFGLKSLGRAILFEKPANVTSDAGNAVVDELQRLRGEGPLPADSISALYAEIRALIVEIGTPELFIGPPSAQFTTQQIVPIPIRGVNLSGKPVYDIMLSAVSNQTTALAAIDQIVTEGEGGPTDPTTSHFARFVTMYIELKAAVATDPTFDPSRPVVDDPDTDGATPNITDPTACALVDLFDLAYGTTVTMLMRYLFQTDESPAEVLALQEAIFFPMMTAVIRPLGELLTTLPARPGSEERAGPAFRLGRNVSFHPHRSSAWQIFHGQLAFMAQQAAAHAIDPGLSSSGRDRLALMSENLNRMAAQFALAMHLPVAAP